MPKKSTNQPNKQTNKQTKKQTNQMPASENKNIIYIHLQQYFDLVPKFVVFTYKLLTYQPYTDFEIKGDQYARILLILNRVERKKKTNNKPNETKKKKKRKENLSGIFWSNS